MPQTENVINDNIVRNIETKKGTYLKVTVEIVRVGNEERGLR